MTDKLVKDIMIPLAEYAVVSDRATLEEAILVLRRISRMDRLARLSPRAVLVMSADGRLAGQIGHLDFLRALEPRYGLSGDLDTLARAGVRQETVGALIDNLAFWQGDLSEACARVRSVPVTDIMHSLKESIDEQTPLSEAIHNVVMWQSLRVPVTRGNEAVGILRLADLFDEIADRFELLNGDSEDVVNNH